MSNLLNTATCGLLGSGMGNLFRDAYNASQKEYDAQVKAAIGPSDEVWNGLVKAAWPDRMPVIPPRRGALAPPRPGRGRPIHPWRRVMP